MNKLQEIKARISKLKGYENAKPTDQYWMDKEHIDFLIDRTELSVKQQEIIEENKRQQEVTVHQFRQAQEEIQRLNGELKQAHEKSGNLLGEWRRAETQTAKISDQLMDMKVMLRMEQGKVQWQKAKNGQLKEALSFYANETNYTKEFEDCPPAIDLDGGQIARKALEGDAE